MNYTKEKWKLRKIQEGDKNTFIGPTDEYQVLSGNGVECIATMGTGWAMGKAKANAQLIASAPDLYEALKELADIMECVIEAPDVAQLDSFTLQPARQALAKAEGK